MHLSTQLPPTHFFVASQLTPAHGSTQLPLWQTWPAGQTAFLQLSTHVPPLQVLPLGHITPTHAFVTQRRSVPHVRPAAHGRQSHVGWQTPPVHT